MTITLEYIKSEHAKVAEMITAFEAQNKTRFLMFGEQTISLNPGEEYAGIIIGKDGAQGHHLILIPGEVENIDWNNANTWAAKAGGELPTRREQSLLFANLKEQFKGAYYWSGEQHASDSACAWSQYFIYGTQTSNDKSAGLRARAVRRLPI